MPRRARRFKVVIECENDAFQGDFLGVEAGRILQQLGDATVESALRPGDEGRLLDVNGNTVGWWNYK